MGYANKIYVAQIVEICRTEAGERQHVRGAGKLIYFQNRTWTEINQSAFSANANARPETHLSKNHEIFTINTYGARVVRVALSRRNNRQN